MERPAAEDAARPGPQRAPAVGTTYPPHPCGHLAAITYLQARGLRAGARACFPRFCTLNPAHPSLARGVALT